MGFGVNMAAHKADASAHHVKYSEKLKYPLGEHWCLPGWFAYDYTTGGFTTGWLNYIPIFVSETTTYIAMGIDVLTAKVGKLARLGIYEWNDGLPGALILDAGTISVGTTGNKIITISQKLQRGYYFLAAVSDDNPYIMELDMSYGCVPPVAGFSVDMNRPDIVVMVTTGRAGDVAGGLPASAPTPDDKRSGSGAFVFLREN